MYDLRYHILTIVGIFLALAIGLVLGLALGRSGAADVTTDSLVRTLQESFDALQEENGSLQAQASAAEGLSEDMLDAWARGRLAGVRALVLAGGAPEAEQAALRALEGEGAQAEVVTLRMPRDSDALNSLAALVGAQGADADSLARTLGDALCAEWRAAGASCVDEASVRAACPLTRELREAGALVLEAPLADVVACTHVVDVALSDACAEPLSLAVAAAYAQTGCASVSAQATGSEAALVQAAWGRGVSGVGDVETTAGRFGLTWLLSGAAPGAYGVDGCDPWPTRARSDAAGSSAADASATSDSSAQDGR